MFSFSFIEARGLMGLMLQYENTAGRKGPDIGGKRETIIAAAESAEGKETAYLQDGDGRPRPPSSDPRGFPVEG